MRPLGPVRHGCGNGHSSSRSQQGCMHQSSRRTPRVVGCPDTQQRAPQGPSGRWISLPPHKTAAHRYWMFGLYAGGCCAHWWEESAREEGHALCAPTRSSPHKQDHGDVPPR